MSKEAKLAAAAMVLATIVLFGGVAPVQGSEFRSFDPKALAMGTAGVARPSPAYAAYYNPAALAVPSDRNNAFGLTIGVRGEETGIAEHLDNLMDMDWDTAIDNPQGTEATRIITEITQITASDGVLIVPTAAFGLKVGQLGFGVYGGGELVVYTDIDSVNINRTDPLTDPNSFFYNKSELYAQALMPVEIPVAYGRQFDLDGKGKLNVGGALKLVEGITFDIGTNVTVDVDNLEELLRDAVEMSMSFGVDLGVQYQSVNDALAVGMVLKNVLSPEFETAAGRTFKEELQARGGVAYTVNDKLSVAADLDLTENNTRIAGHKSRQLGAGVSFQLASAFALRGGIMTNLGADDSTIAVSLGLSIGGEGFHLDLAGVVPTEWQDIQDTTIPGMGGITLALGRAW